MANSALKFKYPSLIWQCVRFLKNTELLIVRSLCCVTVCLLCVNGDLQTRLTPSFKFCNELHASAKMMTVARVQNTVSLVAYLHVIYSFLINLPENLEVC